jgi:hypothetical protein
MWKSIQHGRLRQELKRTLVPLAIIGIVGGFVGDMFAPLGNIGPWAAAISIIIFAGLFVFYLDIRRRNEVGKGVASAPALLTLAGGSALLFALWSLVFAAGPERGYLASSFTPVAGWQASLLGLQPDNAGIQPNNTETTQAADLLATAQATDYAAVQAAYVALQAGQNIIPDPTGPHEWRHNAQIYQLRGDTAGALAAYEGYVGTNLDYVDPYLGYVDLLIATEGSAHAREIIEELRNRRPESITLDLLSAMLLDDPQERLGRLTALAERAPDYGPVYYQLVQEHLVRVRQHLTQSQLAPLKEALASLKRLEETQKYSRLYIDKAQALENLTEAENLVSHFASPLARLKLEFAPSFSAAGVYIAVALPDFEVQELRYNIDEPQPITSTGAISNSATVNTSIGPLSLQKGAHTLYVQYTDGAGVESPLYSYDYTVEDIVMNIAQQPFDAKANGIPVRFTLTVVDGEPDALYTYRYSLDSDALDQSQQGLGSGTIIQLAPVTTGEHTLYVQAELEGAVTNVVQHEFTVR